jgi:hypothetical protein
VAKVFAPIMADLHANAGLCLHQSQTFYWATRESLPSLTWVEMAVGSSRVHEGCDAKKFSTSWFFYFYLKGRERRFITWLGTCHGKRQSKKTTQPISKSCFKTVMA